MNCTVTTFGTLPGGQNVELYELRNVRGVTAKIITYGATLTELHIPDKNGALASVVLGFDNLDQYLMKHPWFGATIGRYANRVAGGTFTIDGTEYTLPRNDQQNTLHGGSLGFDKQLWKAESLHGEDGASVRLKYLSKHLEEGFPGNLSVSVTYTLTDNDELRIDYEATCDRATPINLTHHSYFNLSGTGNGDILDHELMIAAASYTPVDSELVPTGEIRSVSGSPLDFTKSRSIASSITNVPSGYDHNYVLDDQSDNLHLAANVRDPKSGRAMEMWTTEPGVQLYTANSFDGTIKGIGGAYNEYAGLTLEAQHFPDSVHHDSFPSTILRPGNTYNQTTIYKFV